MNAKVRIWIWAISILVLAVPAVGQTAQGYVWGADGRLKEVGEPVQWTEPYEGEGRRPMAGENLWTNGGSTGRWDTAGNWSLGHEPADDEDVILSAVYPDSIVTGFRGVDEDIELRSFHRHKGYTGDVGSSGDPLVASTKAQLNPINAYDNQGKVIVQGPGKFYYKNAPGGVANTTARLYVDTDEQSQTIEVDGDISRLMIVKGRVKTMADFEATFIIVSWRNNPTADAHLTLEHSAAVGRLVQNGGTVECATPAIANLNLYGGRFTAGTSAGGISSHFQAGGICIDKSGEDIVSAHVAGGVLDLSQDPRAKFITTLMVLSGGHVVLNPNTTIGSGGNVNPSVEIGG